MVDTKHKILETGLKMWKEDPSSVNAYAISKRLGIVHGTVLYHFPNSVKDAVADFAVAVGDIEIMAQLIAQNHKAVKNFSTEDRREILFKSTE